MKRTERHHLKENELAHLARTAQQLIDDRKNQALWVLLGAAVVIAVILGVFVWRSSVQGRAHSLLADALVVEIARVGPPPLPGTPSQGVVYATEQEKQKAALAKFKTVADQYPSSDAGLFARYREGTSQMALGNTKEAMDAYQQVIDRAGEGIYGQMARLGQAQAQARAGQYDPAISTFKQMSTRTDSPLPLDGILMQLGKTYLDAGKPADAQQTFNRLVEEFPESPFTSDAKKALDALKKT